MYKSIQILGASVFKMTICQRASNCRPKQRKQPRQKQM